MNHGSRVGIVGAGQWGKNLIRTCAELGALTAVCDASEEALSGIHGEFSNVTTHRDFSNLLLEPIDAVVIAAPAQFHASMALQAIEAGKHVFVEKPLALTVEDGERVAQAAERARLQVFVGHLLLYHPAVRRLRALLAQGAVGRLWHLRSRRLSLGRLRHHESVWWSFAPHDVAIMLAVFGEEPASVVAAQAGWLTPRFPDTAYADYQFSQGRSAHVEVSWLDPQKSWRLDLYGTQGVITVDNSAAGCRVTVTPCGARPDDRGMLTTWRSESQSVSVDPMEALREEVVAFLTSIRFGIPAETDVKEGLAVLRALAMADRACAKNHAQFEVMA